LRIFVECSAVCLAVNQKQTFSGMTSTAADDPWWTAVDKTFRTMCVAFHCSNDDWHVLHWSPVVQLKRTQVS